MEDTLGDPWRAEHCLLKERGTRRADSVEKGRFTLTCNTSNEP